MALTVGSGCPCHTHFTEKYTEAQAQEVGSQACLIRLASQDFSKGLCCTAKFQTLWPGLGIPVTGEAEPEG